jgi:hypothetical protein
MAARQMRIPPSCRSRRSSQFRSGGGRFADGSLPPRSRQRSLKTTRILEEGLRRGKIGGYVGLRLLDLARGTRALARAA